jgi:hypothetical protein
VKLDELTARVHRIRVVKDFGNHDVTAISARQSRIEAEHQRPGEDKHGSHDDTQFGEQKFLQLSSRFSGQLI